MLESIILISNSLIITFINTQNSKYKTAKMISMGLVALVGIVVSIIMSSLEVFISLLLTMVFALMSMEFVKKNLLKHVGILFTFFISLVLLLAFSFTIKTFLKAINIEERVATVNSQFSSCDLNLKLIPAVGWIETDEASSISIDSVLRDTSNTFTITDIYLTSNPNDEKYELDINNNEVYATALPRGSYTMHWQTKAEENLKYSMELSIDKPIVSFSQLIGDFHPTKFYIIDAFGVPLSNRKFKIVYENEAVEIKTDKYGMTDKYFLATYNIFNIEYNYRENGEERTQIVPIEITDTKILQEVVFTDLKVIS